MIGYGYWGPNLLRNLAAHGGCEIIGVVDAKPEARTKAAKIFPHVPTFESLDKFLKEQKPDAVVIATPPSTHCELAVQCLNAGAHVLVEKPLAMSVSECDLVLATARKKGLKVMVDHTFAYNPPVQYLAEQIRNGNLGDLLYYDSVRANLGGFQPRTNVLWDLAPHDLSILDLFTGGKTPVSVTAVAVKHFDTQVENLCYLHLTYSNNFVAHLHLNWVAPIKIRSVMVGGTKKMAVYDENTPADRIKIYDKGVSLKTSPSSQDFKVAYRMGDMCAPAIPNHEALAQMVSEFVEYISTDKACVSDGTSGRRVVQILEAASLSVAQNGKPVELAQFGITELPGRLAAM